MSEEIDSLKEEEKEAFIDLTKEEAAVNGNGAASSAREQRHARHASHEHRTGKDSNLVAGIVLIAIGGIFLLTNLTNLAINNWWALFILIPAFSNFSRAWRSYRENGRLSHSARGSITGGLILTLISSAFLFDFISWEIIWPSFLIILGISALLGGWFD